MGVIVDLIIIAIVALSTYLAYKKGLVALAIKLCAVVISIVITLLLYKPVSNLIINTTSIDETIQNAILEKATDVIRQEEESDLSNEVIDFAKDEYLSKGKRIINSNCKYRSNNYFIFNHKILIKICNCNCKLKLQNYQLLINLIKPEV